MLNPASAETPITLFTIPVIKRQIMLGNLLPASIHNVWTMVAVAILGVFLLKACADYAANCTDQLLARVLGGYRSTIR